VSVPISALGVQALMAQKATPKNRQSELCLKGFNSGFILRSTKADNTSDIGDNRVCNRGRLMA